MAESMTLTQAVENCLSKKSPELGVPFYSKRGDFLTVTFADDPWHEYRIDDVLTVHFSLETNKLVGCTIKGVSLLADNYKTIFKVKDGPIEIRWLLLNGMGQRPVKTYYCNVSDLIGELKCELGGLLEVA